MVKNKSYIKILVGITIFAIIFHLLILIRLIPYEITWGGRLKTVEEMYVFEGVSILINSFYVFILLQKGDFISLFLSKKTITFILWIFFAVFTLNTVGNLLARTKFEKLFALLTLVNAFLIWRINTTKK